MFSYMFIHFPALPTLEVQGHMFFTEHLLAALAPEKAWSNELRSFASGTFSDRDHSRVPNRSSQGQDQVT